MEVVQIDQTVKQNAIVLRREYRLKLPDALIAASALARDAVLVTNDSQLAKIPGMLCQTLKLRTLL